jgi:ABC-type antimicrobial peptide transport system permease subunit
MSSVAAHLVFNLFFAHGAKLIAVGVLGGLCLAIGFKPAVASQLYGVTAIEPWVLAASAALIGLIALTAIVLPAFRASRVDPIKALRDFQPGWQ